jgi:hypothetical protein
LGGRGRSGAALSPRRCAAWTKRIRPSWVKDTLGRRRADGDRIAARVSHFAREGERPQGAPLRSAREDAAPAAALTLLALAGGRLEPIAARKAGTHVANPSRTYNILVIERDSHGRQRVFVELPVSEQNRGTMRRSFWAEADSHFGDSWREKVMVALKNRKPERNPYVMDEVLHAAPDGSTKAVAAPAGAASVAVPGDGAASGRRAS